MRRWIAIGSALLLAAPAAARVAQSGETGFVVEHEATTTATPAAVWAAFARIGQWWEPAHSYSGDPAKHMTIGLEAGGCFCETLPSGGSVQHMTVARFIPPSELVLRGALGPLQGEGVEGAMSIKVTEAGGGSRIALRYVVGGLLVAGAAQWAPAVDRVLGVQLSRLASAAGTPLK